MVVAGALLALLLRLALLLPFDFYSRVVGRLMTSAPPGVQAPIAGWDFWRLGPMTEASGDTPSVIDPAFLRQFVFVTWWIGGVAGLILVRRGGGRATDAACGGVAGAAAGAVGAATLACLTVLFDGLPRAVLGVVNVASAPAWLVTPFWIMLALLCWAGLGAIAGLVLGFLGARGGRILSTAAAPLTWALRACGMRETASFFAS